MLSEGQYMEESMGHRQDGQRGDSWQIHAFVVAGQEAACVWQAAESLC